MSKTGCRQALPFLVALTVAALGLCCPWTAPAATASPAVRPAAEPAPSPRPGYWADTTCSEAGDPANSEGWLPIESAYPFIYGTLNTCNSGGSITARDEAAHDTTAESGPAWWWRPNGHKTSIVSGVAHLTMISPEGDAYVYAYNTKNQPETLVECHLCTTVHSATVTFENIDDWLTVGTYCIPPAGHSECVSDGVNAEANVTDATFLLHTETTPEASGVGGSLTESPVAGNATLQFTGHDLEGPGIYRVAVKIDGSPVWNGTPDLNDEKCLAHGEYDGALNFHASQPCPEEVPVRIEIPTASIPDGPHLVEVELEDAAGNRSVVYDKTITVENHHATTTTPPPSGTPPTSNPTATPTPPSARGPANGDPASEDASITAQWHGDSNATLTSSYGHSRQIEGRLTNSSGAAIAGAVIEVNQRASSLGAIASAMPTVHTGSNGAFTVNVPASDSSASIELAYRSHLGDATAAATRTLSLRVAAHLHLTVSPHVTRVGQTIELRGTLSGPLPASGKQVIFEARAVGSKSWIEFHNVTVRGAGHFKTKHRFKLPGPERYQFRVICEPEPAFAFERGVSNTVVVHER